MLPRVHPVKKTYIELRRSKERLQLYIESNNKDTVSGVNAIEALNLISTAIVHLEKIDWST